MRKERMIGDGPMTRRIVGALASTMVFFVPAHLVASTVEGRNIYALFRLGVAVLYLGICLKDHKRGRPLGAGFWILSVYLAIVLAGTAMTLLMMRR